MKQWQIALKHAFYYTVPILFGYLALGIAFGVLLEDKGYNFLWAFFMSVIIYSGSAQFLAVGFLASGLDLFSIGLISLLVSVRHVFYGLSMIDKFKDMKKKKPYMIFALTDETYSILCSAEIPPRVDKNLFMFFVALLDHSYWIIGSVLGAAAGGLMTFDSTGIDFAMTALFVVIFVEQWKTYKTHIPALTGIIATVICLWVFGSDNFIVFSMIAILAVMTVSKKYIQSKLDCSKEEAER